MGHYNLAPQRVHQHATMLLEASLRAAQSKKIHPDARAPAWYGIIGANPPSETLVRPVMQRPHKAGKKASRMFSPIRLSYEEDRLRWEYFNDHPWELARPRIVLENDGKDRQKWNWGVPLDHGLRQPLWGAKDEFGNELMEEWTRIRQTQCRRPINGESVIQRQAWLMRSGLSEAAAYDKARKEYYRVQHYRETELRVAREEALATGGFFTLGPMAKSELLEDEQYKNWKAWAAQRIAERRAIRGAAYTGMEVEEESSAAAEGLDGDGLDDIADSLPGTKEGQEALGGVPAFPAPS